MPSRARDERAHVDLNTQLNPLANYLAAQDYFRSGQGDLAFRELEAASRKSEFNDLTLS